MPHCPHCNRDVFGIVEGKVAGKKLLFVQCSGCKAPVGVVESTNVGLTEVIRVLISSLQRLNARLERIEQALGN
jgi:hypothetical protein